MPLGYLLGFLLLTAAARGYWKIALILPLYFLADATITLLRRLVARRAGVAGRTASISTSARCSAGSAMPPSSGG